MIFAVNYLIYGGVGRYLIALGINSGKGSSLSHALTAIIVMYGVVATTNYSLSSGGGLSSVSVSSSALITEQRSYYC